MIDCPAGSSRTLKSTLGLGDLPPGESQTRAQREGTELSLLTAIQQLPGTEDAGDVRTPPVA
jgi:hypothetical protein